MIIFKKKKRILITAVFLVVLLIASAALFIILQEDSSTPNLEIDEGVVTVPEGVSSDTSDFDAVLTLRNEEKYEEGLEEAIKYSRSDSNPLDQRLSIYDLCIDMAIITADIASKDVCHNEGLNLTSQQESQEAREGWVATLNARYNEITIDNTDEFEENELR